MKRSLFRARFGERKRLQWKSVSQRKGGDRMTCQLRRNFSLCLMFFLLLALVRSVAAADSLEYSWGAFQRSWNRMALPGVEIREPRRVGDGYLVLLSNSTSLNIFLNRGVVSGVRVNFRLPDDEEISGMRFLKGMRTAIRVGTYGWPQDKIQAVYKAFEVMLPERKEFTWHYSRFTRVQYPNGDWEFTLHFVPLTR